MYGMANVWGVIFVGVIARGAIIRGPIILRAIVQVTIFLGESFLLITHIQQ